MKLYVGITDYDWFSLHASKEIVEEVNFWRPSPSASFKALQPGDMFLFKLRERRFIGGGGFFAKYLPLPLSLAWDSFQEGNGARSLDEFRKMIARNRHQPISLTENPFIGCILLEEPFFFLESQWIRLPDDFKPGIQRGKTYEIETATGLMLWNEVATRLPFTTSKTLGPATEATQERARFGRPILVQPRLGQGTFRALVTDAYNYRCVITSEKILPVLEAAHIRPYENEGVNEVSNGLLLRSDLHKLLDKHYLSIDPKEKTLIVSRRLHEDFDNGKNYRELNGTRLADPKNVSLMPSFDNLAYRFELFQALEASR